MKNRLPIIILVISLSACYSQGLKPLDSLKVSLTDTSIFEEFTIYETQEDIETIYSIRRDKRKDGLWLGYSDSTLKTLVFQTEIKEGNRVGKDTYWYSNGFMKSQFSLIETYCYDTTFQFNKSGEALIYASCFNSFRRVGQFRSWHENGKPKSSGSYIMIDRCSSARHGVWTFWNKEGIASKVTYSMGLITKKE